MTENLDQLRQVAERATPGPWAAFITEDDDGLPENVAVGAGEYISSRGRFYRSNDLIFEVDTSTYEEGPELDEAVRKAEFIATFDPNTVLALIDRVEAAEAAVSNQRSVVKTLAERNVELTKFKDAYSLQAQELEQAEAERDFRQKENKELFEQIERVRELASEYRKTIPEEVLHSVMVDICRTLDGGEQE